MLTVTTPTPATEAQKRFRLLSCQKFMELRSDFIAQIDYLQASGWNPPRTRSEMTRAAHLILKNLAEAPLSLTDQEASCMLSWRWFMDMATWAVRTKMGREAELFAREALVCRIALEILRETALQAA